MLLLSLLLIPLVGIFAIFINIDNEVSSETIKLIALTASIINLFISLVIFILFDFSTNQFQFVQEYYEISYYDFYLGVDGLSIYFILLTTLIIPISIVSNWKSITKDIESYVIIILLLESLLLAVFLVLDILLFYIFFESILPPLFILIGIFGSDNRVKASFYLFLYTLLGSLFLLLSILAMSSIMSTTDFDTLFKGNFIYLTQLFLFYGIFIAFAVKTPTIFLNTWLLKAHVESPLGGSIILAAIVLKLSLYGILRLILPILPKAYMVYTYVIFLIGVITIIYASLSTLRTIDVKELIAYSSVSHAAVYLLGVFSNCIQGIEGAINLGLAHGLVSPGLFICGGGVLYDRSSTRIITFYRGVTQVMPLFSILFFLLCLANCGAPLTLNFIGEFLSLYGVFERSSLFGIFASSSIIFSAAYTIYMYQRIAFGGVYSSMFMFNIPDLTKREFVILFVLVLLTILFGVYPAPIVDGLNYGVTTLIYNFDSSIISCDSPKSWEFYLSNNSYYHNCFGLFFWIAIMSIAIKYWTHIKYSFNIRIKFIWYFILANLSISSLIVIFYILYIICVLFFTIQNIMFNVFSIGALGENYYTLADNYCTIGEVPSDLTKESLPEWKKHVFLASTGDNGSSSSSGNNPFTGDNGSSSSGGRNPFPSNLFGHIPPQPTPPQPTQSGQFPSVPDAPIAAWIDQYGFLQKKYYVDIDGKLTIFRPDWRSLPPYEPPAPRTWEPVGGQGDNPVYFTKASHGETLTKYNTFNTSKGYIDYCESKRTVHRWNPTDIWNLNRNNGSCFNCDTTIDFSHHSCDNCYRKLCLGCNKQAGYYADINFNRRCNGR